MPAKQVTPISLESLGAKGLNTQSLNSSLGPEWLTIADNVVYDLQGRMGPRKGSKQVTKTVASPIKSIGAYIKPDSTVEVYGGSGATVVKMVTSVVPYSLTTQSFSGTPQTISDSNWQWINFNEEFWGVQTGHKVINYDGTSWYDIDDLGAYVAASGVTTFDPACAMGHFGRMWYGGITEDKGVLFYSDTLIGEKLNTGAAGSLDLKTVWGSDEIVGIASLEDKIIIFGKHNIVTYSGASNPSTMVLNDLIKGEGLAGRDNIVDVGVDLLFLSYDGLKSFKRITQSDGKSPVDDTSIAVRNDLARILVSADVSNIKSVYNQEDGQVITFIPDDNITYCFNFNSGNKVLPKITTWTFTNEPQCGVDIIDGKFYMGLSDSIASYESYLDVVITNSTPTYGSEGVCEAAGNTWETSTCWTYTQNTYNWTFQTSWLDLGSPSFSKIVKKGLLTISGGQDSAATISISKDFDETSVFSKTFNLVADSTSYLWGASGVLYGAAKYAPTSFPKEYKVSLARTGKVIRIKLVVECKGHNSNLVNTMLLTKQGKIR